MYNCLENYCNAGNDPAFRGVIAESEYKQINKLYRWNDGMESEGLKVNMNKTKVMTAI